MEIRLLHLYHDLMNLYGEYGNISILSKKLSDLGFDTVVDKKTVGDSVSFEDYDFIFIGCSTERNQLVALQDLVRYKDNLKQAIESGRVILSTGNSFEIFGRYIQDKGGNKINALGIFDFYTLQQPERTASDVILTADFIEEKVIGFINKMSINRNIDNPLFKVLYGIVSNENNDYEGIRYNNFFGTNVIGPLLVKNPDLLDYIIRLICNNKNPELYLPEIRYDNQIRAYEVSYNELVNRLTNRK